MLEFLMGTMWRTKQNRTKNNGPKSRVRYNDEKKTSVTRIRDLKMERERLSSARDCETRLLYCLVLHKDSFLRAIYQFGVSEPNDECGAPLLNTKTLMTQLKKGPMEIVFTLAHDIFT